MTSDKSDENIPFGDRSMKRYILIEKKWLCDTKTDFVYEKSYDVITRQTIYRKSNKLNLTRIYKFMPYSKVTEEYDEPPFKIMEDTPNFKMVNERFKKVTKKSG